MMASSDVVSACLDNDKFRERWNDIYKSADDYILSVRITCQEVFQQEDWINGTNYVMQSMYDIANRTDVCDKAYKYMFGLILQYYEELEKLPMLDQAQKLNNKVVYDNIKDTYENNPQPFIESLVRYLAEEQHLLRQFQSQEEEMEAAFSDDQDQVIREIEDYAKKINESVDKFGKLEDSLMARQSYTDINGIVDSQHTSKQREIILEMKTLISHMEKRVLDAEKILHRKMKAYKLKLQHFYVDLMELRPQIPSDVERGFSRLGKVLYEVLHYNIPKLDCLTGDKMLDSSRLMQFFKNILHMSFVVTEQQKHIIKVELGSKKRNKEADDGSEEGTNQKFKCPKFFATVRLLACDSIDCKGKVKAQFCHEMEVNEKYSIGRWDKPCEFKLKSKTDESTFEKKKALASFKKMELERFERKSDIQVCEDKFRIVFTTQIKLAEQEIPIYTTSLPVVVTTGASQSCNVHGSLLWQCFSNEDAFQLPIENQPSLKWGKVFDMLNEKIRTLGGRELCHDEKAHLGCRLMNENEPITDDMDIPFRKFCIDKMMDIPEGIDKKKSATFWMWFLAVFNLTKTHLKDYWKENMIAGFITKEVAEKRLRQSYSRDKKEFIYLLRYSDKVITDGQGQNLCGAISATVVYTCKVKGKMKCIPTEPFKSDTFKKKSLAQCVKNTCMPGETKQSLLQWLFKATGEVVHTEEAFKDFYIASESRGKGETPGYKKFEEMLIIKIGDMNIDEESSPERKRDFKKAVLPSKKREASQGKAGHIKSKRLSEPRSEPASYGDSPSHQFSPMSMPADSPRSTVIPQTVFEVQSTDSQDTQIIYQRTYNDQPDIMDVIYNHQPSLSTAHPTLTQMLTTTTSGNLSTIDPSCLGNMVSVSGQEHPGTIVSNVQPVFVDGKNGIYDGHCSPAGSVSSMQSPGHGDQQQMMLQQSPTYAPIGNNLTIVGPQQMDVCTNSIVVNKPKNSTPIGDQMQKFKNLTNKMSGLSSDLQSPTYQQQIYSPNAPSPANSVASSNMEEGLTQEAWPASQPPLQDEEIAHMISNINKKELIENLQDVFLEMNQTTGIN